MKIFNDSVINTLLSVRGTDVNARGRLGQTALHLAIEQKAPQEIIARLLAQGADVNLQDNCGDTALHTAIKRNVSPEIIARLLDQGADVNQDNCGETALHLAIRRDVPQEIIARLLDQGADVNLQDHIGYTALHTAIRRDVPQDIIAWLLAQGADVNHKDDIAGETALHLAIGRNVSPEIITLFLDKGANSNIQDVFKQTALDTAILLDRNPLLFNEEILTQTNVEEELAPIRQITRKNVQLLLQKLKVDEQNQEGNTPLLQYLCCCQRRKIPITEEILTVFLSRHANPYLANPKGKMAVHSILEHPQLSNGLKRKVLLHSSALGLLLFVLQKTNPLEKMSVPNEIHQRILFYSLLSYFPASTLPDAAESKGIMHMFSKIDTLFDDNNTVDTVTKKAIQRLLKQ